MPLSRRENTTFATPSIIDFHDMGLRTVFTVQTPKGKRLFNAYSAQKPRLPDSIDHPIAAMPPSRMQNSTLVKPLIEDLSRYGIEDCSYSPEAPKSNA
ncbi:hypothetical protein TNCV_5000341 [Trichonephila clavipes]|nr:hypothetical protein TNCV_5000341 [Trichonephila clavipes]